MMNRTPLLSFRRRRGFSLVEMLVTVFIISILVVAVVHIGGVVYTNARLKTTENTIKIVRDALTQYQATLDKQDGAFAFPTAPDDPRFSSSDYTVGNIGLFEALEIYFRDVYHISVGSSVVTIVPRDHNNATWKDSNTLSVAMNNALVYARCTNEFIYCVLNDVPASRAVLDKLPKTAVANEDGDSATVADRPVQFTEILDAWGHPIRYESTGSGNFPILRSAGPDAAFNTADDIVSTDF